MSSDQADLAFENEMSPPAEEVAEKPAAKKAARKRVAKKAARKTARKATKKVARKKATEAGAAEESSSESAISVPKLPTAADEDVPQSFSTDDADLKQAPPPAPAEPEPESQDEKAAEPEPEKKEPEEVAKKPARGPKGQKPQQGKQREFKQKPYNKQGGQKKGQGFQKQGKRQQRRKGREPQRKRKPQEESNLRAEWGELPELALLKSMEKLVAFVEEITDSKLEPIYLEELLHQPFLEMREWAEKEFDIAGRSLSVRQALVEAILDAARARKQPVYCRGIVESIEDGNGLVVYQSDNYQIRPASSFIPRVLVKKYAIKKGTIIEAQVHPRRKPLPDDAIDQLKAAGRSDEAIDAIPEGVEEDLAVEALSAIFSENEYVQDIEAEEESCPYVVKIHSLMGKAPEENLEVTPFEDLVPYYPTERIILETEPKVKWDNTAMRVVDLLTPVGLGQRGLIVAPPRTGKTILQQGVANAVAINTPNAHLIVLLIDERPEEVTDFRRQITSGEVIASTFDESPESHVHCAEMVIEKSRRMVENGEHVIILLDSITRLARAYNALASNSGKILSGGVEANALQKPKRFFGSARNIEGAGSLTILGTALVETGSRMDEVIFEEFKGTGNMELHLDRALSDKRIFPAIEMNKSGTRKEELLYHPEEMMKVYGLRRAMKGVPPTDAMEMLITRIKKTTTNIQFLVGVNT
ncbi:MAG: transcription termination factor Rho [Puniceicoccaceae bacterium]